MDRISPNCGVVGKVVVGKFWVVEYVESTRSEVASTFGNRFAGFV